MVLRSRRTVAKGGEALATRVKFVAWTVPVPGMPRLADHTWVTTYDNRNRTYANLQQVIDAKQFYWYCYGNFHPIGGTLTNASGFLGERDGNLAQARCLVEPNADSWQVNSARGT